MNISTSKLTNDRNRRTVASPSRDPSDASCWSPIRAANTACCMATMIAHTVTRCCVDKKKTATSSTTAIPRNTIDTRISSVLAALADPHDRHVPMSEKNPSAHTEQYSSMYPSVHWSTFLFPSTSDRAGYPGTSPIEPGHASSNSQAPGGTISENDQYPFRGHIRVPPGQNVPLNCEHGRQDLWCHTNPGLKQLCSTYVSRDGSDSTTDAPLRRIILW